MSLSLILRSKPYFLEPPVFPSLTNIKSKVDRIFQRWPETSDRFPEDDHERLIKEIKERITTGQWQGTRLSLVLAAARVCFDKRWRELDDWKSVRQFYYDETYVSDRGSFLDTMFSVYLDSYEPASLHTTGLARALSASRKHLGYRWSNMLKNIPECLYTENAHAAIAARMTGMANPWGELKALGMGSPHAPGLMDYVHLSFIDMLRDKLTRREEMARLIAWLDADGTHHRSTDAGIALTALLEPWKGSRVSEENSSYLTEQITRMYGDPRLRRGGIWTQVSSQAMAIILAWLTGENIRFFLDVVSAVEDSHMWAPRRDFWLKLYEMGRIDAAWVAFSPPAVDEARRIRSYIMDHQTLAYGFQTERGNRSKTSLLILKIGRKIVVEGSHNYKVHIFDENDERAPALYKNTYNCEVIRNQGSPKVRAHQSGWQNWVMENI